MQLHGHDELINEASGRIDALAGEKYERESNNHLIGEAIKQICLKQCLTQKLSGALVGVQETQISKIESGKSLAYSTIVTIVKAFKAMGAQNATLD